MNTHDLAQALSKEIDIPLRKSEEIVNKVFDTMSETLVSGDRIEVRGFGSFQIKKYKRYTGRNPKTGEKIVVESKKLPYFKVGKDFRERLNQE
jgi:integration host factor subunit beta